MVNVKLYTRMHNLMFAKFCRTMAIRAIKRMPKSVIESFLNEMQTLFDSLMQKYFG